MKPRKHARIEVADGDYNFEVDGRGYGGKMLNIHFPSGSVVAFVGFEPGVGPVSVYGLQQVSYWARTVSLDDRRREVELPLFDDFETDDSDPKELSEAHQAGSMARLGQMPMASCPYPAESAARQAWLDGWSAIGAS